jgi:hypothetical protein
MEMLPTARLSPLHAHRMSLPLPPHCRATHPIVLVIVQRDLAQALGGLSGDGGLDGLRRAAAKPLRILLQLRGDAGSGSDYLLAHQCQSLDVGDQSVVVGGSVGVGLSIQLRVVHDDLSQKADFQGAIGSKIWDQPRRRRDIERVEQEVCVELDQAGQSRIKIGGLRKGQVQEDSSCQTTTTNATNAAVGHPAHGYKGGYKGPPSVR